MKYDLREMSPCNADNTCLQCDVVYVVVHTLKGKKKI